MFFRSYSDSFKREFHAPSPNTIKRKVMRSYANCKKNIASILNAEGNGKYCNANLFTNDIFTLNFTGKISTTTDIWRSTNNYGIMTVTASWITQDFQLREIIIGFREIIGDVHTGTNIADTFWKILCEYKIEEKVVQKKYM